MMGNNLEFESNPEMVLNFHDGTNEQISIIVVHSKDQPDFLNICLQSIHVCSHMNNYEVIVVDNGSGKETQDYLDVLETEGIKVVKNEKNLYWSAAANKGVQAASKNSKYLLFLHHDVVVLNRGWIDILVNASVTGESGFIGVELASYYLNKSKIDYIPEYCLLMTRECLEDIGPWPDSLPQIGHSFILTQKAQKKGYKPRSLKNQIIHHYKNFNLEPGEYKKLQEEASPVIFKLIKEVQYGI